MALILTMLRRSLLFFVSTKQINYQMPASAEQWLRLSGGVLVDSGSLAIPIAFGGPGDTVYLAL